MVGIVRNATITFSNKQELKDFNKRLNKSTVNISRKELQKEVDADGIKITRGHINE